MQHLHPKAKWLFFWQYILRYTFGIIFLSVWLGFSIVPFAVRLLGSEEAGIGVTSLALVLSLFLFFVFSASLTFFLYLWASWTYRNYRYQFTEDTIKIERGVIAKKYSSVPYERIQNVDIHRGILDRLLRLSDIQIQTAGYSGYILSEGRLPGLDPQTAEQLREELIKKVKGTAQGL